MSEVRASSGLTRLVNPFALVFASLFLVGFGNSMLFSVLPPIAREVGMPDWNVGAVFSVSAVLWVLTSPIWGEVSDRVGRKPVITGGLAAYAASMGGFAVAAAAGMFAGIGALATFLCLAGARAIFGAFGSATSPAAQAYVADTTPPARRMQALAALTSAFALGSAVGPAFCALLAAEVGLLAPLVLVTAMAAAMAGVLQAGLPRVAAPLLAKGARPAPSWRFAGDPRVRSYLIYGVALSLATGVMLQTFTFYVLDRLGLSGAEGAEQAAYGFTAGAGALLLTQLALLPRLRLGPRGLMVLGPLLVVGGIGVQISAQDMTWLALSQAVQGVGFGLARPGFTSGASLSTRADEQGVVAGLVVASNGAGFVISPLAGNALYGAVGMNAPLVLTIAVLLAMAAYARFSSGLKAGSGGQPPAPAPE